MRKFVGLGMGMGFALALALSGCAEYQLAKSALAYAADATVPATVGIVAANAFDGFEAEVSDAEIDCTPRAVPLATQLPAELCSAQASNIRILAAAVHAGQPLRNDIEPKGAGAQPVSGSIYNKLESEIGIIESTLAIFNAAKGA